MEYYPQNSQSSRIITSSWQAAKMATLLTSIEPPTWENDQNADKFQEVAGPMKSDDKLSVAMNFHDSIVTCIAIQVWVGAGALTFPQVSNDFDPPVVWTKISVLWSTCTGS